jgi:hypothetical protein
MHSAFRSVGRGGVIKLTSIAALDTLDGTTKLRGHIGEEVRKGGDM